MDAASTEDGPFPRPKIYLSSSLPGSSVPIRAPLTIDSDSEFFIFNNDQICSRTSSFNSTSSIDISSYGDEHTSVREEEDDTFLAYTDQEILIETCRVKEYSCATPFVKYPDGNFLKVRSNFDESTIYSPAVKTPCEESSSVADFRIKSGMPLAPLTSDCDSDIDSVEGHRWLDSGDFPADGIVQKVTMSPKVRVLSGDEGEDEADKESHFEGMFSDDSIDSINELSASMKDSILPESIEDEEHKVDCLEESIEDEEHKVDCLTESIEYEEHKVYCLEESIEDEEHKVDCLTESIEYEEHKVDCLNVAELQRIDAEFLSNSNNEIKIETISDYDSESKNAPSEKEEETQVEIQPIKSKFLNLIRLLGLSDQDSKAMQFLHRLAIGKNNFDSKLTILAIGKTGVGKTATINSIFGENKAITHPYGPGTDFVQEIVGNIDGVHLKILDTPGLRCSPSERSYNLKVLSNIKRFIRKHTPDFVLYVDRLDMYTWDHNDSHLLTLITSSLGSSVWRNCIIALTHAGSNDHEPFGEFVLARCRFMQEQIVWGLCNPVWLVENHTGYRRDTNWRNRVIGNEDEYGHIKPFEPLGESGILWRSGLRKVTLKGMVIV